MTGLSWNVLLKLSNSRYASAWRLVCVCDSFFSLSCRFLQACVEGFGGSFMDLSRRVKASRKAGIMVVGKFTWNSFPFFPSARSSGCLKEKIYTKITVIRLILLQGHAQLYVLWQTYNIFRWLKPQTKRANARKPYGRKTANQTGEPENQRPKPQTERPKDRTT